MLQRLPLCWRTPLRQETPKLEPLTACPRDFLPIWPVPDMIDCDIHDEVPSLQALYPYLPEHWVDYCDESAFVGPDADDYPEPAATSYHPEYRELLKGTSGSATENRLALVQEHVLDKWGIEVGVLNPSYRVQSIHWLDLAESMATAINAWQEKEWVEKDSRLRASLVVPSQNPQVAAAEVERWRGNPAFVQVVLPARSHMPYGNRNFDPMFAAIEKAGLKVAVSFGGSPGNPPSGVGWPNTYFEIHAGMAQVFQSQVMNMVYEGLFDRFPGLKVVLLEGGFTWAPSLMWRMDKEWKGLRHNVPWVKELPSQYMRRHFRWSMLPLDESPVTSQNLEVLEQMQGEDLLMFSSDFPHWHFSDTDSIWPDYWSDSVRRKLGWTNPREFYNL